MNITQIAPQAWLVVGDAHHANSLVLARAGEALLIDAVGGETDARTLRQFVSNELGKSARFVISTHYFSDHMAALKWFPEAEIITHQRYRETWDIEQFRSSEEAEFFVEPSITFDQRMQLRWGSFNLRLQANPGHTPNTIYVDIPELDLVCAGDTFVGGIAYIRYGDPEAALERLAALRRGRHLASHGGVRSDDPPTKALAYLRALRAGHREFDLTPFERVFHGRNLEDLAT